MILKPHAYVQIILKKRAKYTFRNSLQSALYSYIYRSSSYQDELGWAGVWLYQATGENKYLTYAEVNRVNGTAWGDSWDDKTASTNVGSTSAKL